MKIEQSFTVSRPIDDVWAFFQRVHEVAACMPGAELTGETSPGRYTGKVTLKLGPFGGSFDGEAAVTFDQAAKSGHVDGKGVDKRGGSRSRMTVDFALQAPSPVTTAVRLDADVTLSGAIAQFGRTGIIQETAKILIGDFVTKLEQRLAPVAAAASPVAAAAAPQATEPPTIAREPTEPAGEPSHPRLVPSAAMRAGFAPAAEPTKAAAEPMKAVAEPVKAAAATEPVKAAAPAGINGLSLMWRLMIGWIQGLFGHQG